VKRVVVVGDHPVCAPTDDHSTKLKVDTMQQIKRLRFLILILLSLLGSVTLTTAQSTPTELVAVAWSPDGTMIAGGGTNGVLRVWDASTNALLLDLVGDQEVVFAVAWSPDSTQLASGGRDGFTRIWNVKDSQLPPGYLNRELEGYRNIATIDWSPDGAMLASASPSTAGSVPGLFIWETTNYTLINQITIGMAQDIEWHSINNYEIALADQSSFIDIFDPEIDLSLPPRGYLPVTTRVDVGEYVTEISWNSDGSKLAIGGEFGTIYIMDTVTRGILRSFAGHSADVSALAWTPDDRYIASAASDNMVKIWDATTVALVSTYTLNKSYPYTNYIAWSPDGTQLVYGDVGDTPVRVTPPLELLTAIPTIAPSTTPANPENH
jgi:WD40 repeat protein